MYYVYSRATTFRTVVGLLYGSTDGSTSRSTEVRKYFRTFESTFESTFVLSYESTEGTFESTKVVVLSYEIENTFVLSKVYCRDPGAGGPAGGAGIEWRV